MRVEITKKILVGDNVIVVSIKKDVWIFEIQDGRIPNSYCCRAGIFVLGTEEHGALEEFSETLTEVNVSTINGSVIELLIIDFVKRSCSVLLLDLKEIEQELRKKR